MSEVHVQLNSTEEVSPAIIWPTDILPSWSAIYGIAANTEVVESSEIHNPDGPTGTNSVSEPVTFQVGTSVISNPTPYFWPDLTNMSPGSWHATPYTGPPQPVTN